MFSGNREQAAICSTCIYLKDGNSNQTAFILHDSIFTKVSSSLINPG
ncbi:hypothetical protein HMPREF3039_00654 [Akkermansia sp. KLE1798]|nr:hypothetical protein HMPREF3039_00654 [Akkermansia sp. KLE1798]